MSTLNTPIRAVFWDVGGTLVEFAAPLIDHVRASMRRCELHDDLVADDHIARTYADFAAQEATWRSDVDALAACQRWAEAMVGPVASRETVKTLGMALHDYHDLFKVVAGVRELIREIRDRGITQVVVSNWSPTLPAFLRFHGLYDLFDGVAFSAEDGIRKPDERIFVRALRLAKVEAGEAIFIGDSRENDIVPAIALGMAAIHFDPRRRCESRDAETTEQLREKLIELIEARNS